MRVIIIYCFNKYIYYKYPYVEYAQYIEYKRTYVTETTQSYFEERFILLRTRSTDLGRQLTRSCNVLCICFSGRTFCASVRKLYNLLPIFSVSDYK